MSSTTVTLTDAQIKALPTTQVQILARPGAGLTLVVLAAAFVLDTTAGAYVEHSPTSFFAYSLVDEDGNGAQTDWVNASSSLLSTVTQREFVGSGSEVGAGDLVGVLVSHSLPGVNRAVNIQLSGWSANFTGGNAANTLKVTALYLAV